MKSSQKCQFDQTSPLDTKSSAWRVTVTVSGIADNFSMSYEHDYAVYGVFLRTVTNYHTKLRVIKDRNLVDN